MEPISRLGRMMGLVRSGRSGKTRDGRLAASSGAARGQARAADASLKGVREQIAASLQGIDLDTPQGRQRGIRIFLETVFRDELGEGLTGSPRFSDIVNEVQVALTDDQQIHAELIGLLRETQSQP